MSIVFLDRDTFAASVRFGPAAVAGRPWHDYACTPVELVLDRTRAAEVVVTNKVRLPGTLIEQLPQLRLIACAATGVDNVDIEAARRCGVAVCNVRGYAMHSVPEHVFAMLLALRRNLLRYRQAVQAGDWARSDSFCLLAYTNDDLAGATLGIIGAGALGLAVARLGQAFGMNVLLAEHRGAETVRPQRVPFDQVLSDSDVISLHLPLTPQTRHLIGSRELSRMKRNAILVNSARGGVVDEAALLAALRAGNLGGACLDVLSEEPPAADHPLLSADLPNLLITPHIAWASSQAQQRLADEVVENIAAFFRGEPRNRVV
ncbi:MAG: D-2-hydroxyacid dehydrogenase [Gammaproteobacteria bacterium]|nr:D-2-hydroxyacid dehydrogenase [Gammaproteobacteria bacterium]